MAAKNGNGFWKWVCTLVVAISLSILGTGYASWVSFGGGVHRTEVMHMIQVESPYVKDKSAIEVRLKHIEEMVTEIYHARKNQ